MPDVQLSVIVPALDEEDNIEPLVAEVGQVLAGLGMTSELVLVDDGSRDATADRCLALMPERPWLRLVRMPRNVGQSAALHAGLRSARGELVAMLDADLQNDVADLPRLLAVLGERGADWVQGVRRARSDRDAGRRRIGSAVGRLFRRLVLGDTIEDTGCSARVLRREAGLAIPLQFRGMHRFMPGYARRLGWTVVECDVNHRPRHAGIGKYGSVNRAIAGLVDLFAVRWMFARLTPVASSEVFASREAGRG